jgi:hypothetical protein
MANCNKYYVGTEYDYQSETDSITTCSFTFNLPQNDSTTLELIKDSSILCDVYLDTGTDLVLFDQPISFNSTFSFSLKIIINNYNQSFSLKIKQSNCDSEMVEYNFNYKG